MNNKSILLVLMLCALYSCSPKINSTFTKRYPALNASDSIQVYSPDQYRSIDIYKDEVLGSIVVRDGGFTTNCGYDRMLQIVKDTARKNGGNIIGLKAHVEPNILGSSCHQFDADILKRSTLNTDTLVNKHDTIKDNFYVKVKDTVKHKFLLNFTAGVAFKLGKRDNSSEFTKAVGDAVNRGTQLSFSGLYKYNKTSGFGFKYSYATYGGSIDNVTLTFNHRPTEYGVYDIDTAVHFFGLNLYSNYGFGNQKNEFLMDASFGYFSYKEVSGIDTDLTVKGGNLGLDFNIGYKRYVSEKFGIGMNLGVFMGNLKDYTISDGQITENISLDTENLISLSNFNLGAILSYKF